MNQLPILSGSAEGKPAVNNAAAASEKGNATADSQPFGEMLARQLGEKNATTNKQETLKNNGNLNTAALKSSLEEALDDAGDAALIPGDVAASPVGPDLLAILPMPLSVNDLLPQLAASGATSKQPPRVSRQRMQTEDGGLRPTTRDDNPRSTRNAKAAPSLMTIAAASGAGMAADSRIAATQITDNATMPTAAQNTSPLLSAAVPLPLPATSPAAPTLQTAIATPFAHAQWADDFGQKITWLATQNQQRAELHLNPAHLGPLDVSLKLNGDQATVLFSSPHATVREAIEQSLPKLREMFADNGIMLGGATVTDQSQHEQHSESGNPHQAGFNSQRAETVATAGTRHPTGISQHEGMVDTFA
ncbi:MAG: flagellar hook-length control protein FliK [Sideroxyarcus sp.]|nr:flagellar hook-length control protein FliK [Sideroxyarcus sp.]